MNINLEAEEYNGMFSFASLDISWFSLEKNVSFYFWRAFALEIIVGVCN